MKVLSIKNPYSWIVVHGLKDVENRTWTTDFRGKLLIHSSGNIDFKELPNYDRLIPEKIIKEAKELEKITIKERKISSLCQKYIDHILFTDNFLNEKKEYYYKAGYIIGSVELIDIVKKSKSLFAEKGAYHWLLENPIVFEKPVKIKGKLGLWDFDYKEVDICQNQVVDQNMSIQT